MCMSMVCKICVCTVRPDPGGFGWTQRELDAGRRARLGRQRSTTNFLPQCLRHTSIGRNWALPSSLNTGFLLFFYSVMEQIIYWKQYSLLTLHKKLRH